MTGFIDFELSILDGIQDVMGSTFFDKFWEFFTHLGDSGMIWIAITLLLLVFKKTRKIGIICAISLVFSLIFTNLLLKNLVGRLRPYTYNDFMILIKEPHDYSFPSGHTSASFAVAFVMLKERFKLNRYNIYIPVLILAILVSFSRLYLYVHFPTDIIGAIVIAYLCSYLARLIYNRLKGKLLKRA